MINWQRYNKVYPEGRHDQYTILAIR